jgi:hypothetical protein
MVQGIGGGRKISQLGFEGKDGHEGPLSIEEKGRGRGEDAFGAAAGIIDITTAFLLFGTTVTGTFRSVDLNREGPIEGHDQETD